MENITLKNTTSKHHNKNKMHAICLKISFFKKEKYVIKIQIKEVIENHIKTIWEK